jgi:hypothetical protein
MCVQFSLINYLSFVVRFVFLQTPEFFYMPEFLENHNDFDYGLPSGDLGNVELPPWARDPVTFVRLNREALGISLSSHFLLNLICTFIY